MIKKLLITMIVLSTYLIAAINVQTASKAELMNISGIGEKKASAIIKYRKTHKLKSPEDLLKVKGIGKGIVKNVKGNVKNKSKSSTKSKKSSTKKKSKTLKKVEKSKDKKKSTKKKKKSKKDDKKKSKTK